MSTDDAISRKALAHLEKAWWPRWDQYRFCRHGVARDWSDIDDDELRGTVGIKEDFHAVHPVANYPPANPDGGGGYLKKWNAQVALFRALGIPLGFNPKDE